MDQETPEEGASDHDPNVGSAGGEVKPQPKR
jgi:hypothetical protein